MNERFWSKVQVTGFCWLWTGATTRGYGMFRVGPRMQYAHRVAYKELVGPIPDGHQGDHLCRIPLCVNPDHLEPVTQVVNIARGRVGAHNRAKTTCPRNHPYDRRTPDGRRYCNECRRERRAERKESV